MASRQVMVAPRGTCYNNAKQVMLVASVEGQEPGPQEKFESAEDDAWGRGEGILKFSKRLHFGA